MQSLNKIPSFGDDTLHACIQAEVKNANSVYNDSDIDKYFKDSTFLAKIKDKSNDVDKINQSNQNNLLHTLIKTKTSLNQDYSELGKLKTDTIAKKKFHSKTNTLKQLKLRSITSTNRNCDLSKIGQENVNTNYAKSDFSSNTNTPLKQCEKSKFLHTDNYNIERYATQDVMNNITDIKSSNTNITGSNGEISSITNPSIFTIATQERYKLASWGLPQSILQVTDLVYLKNSYEF